MAAIPLTVALTSVLAARMAGAGRPELLVAMCRRDDPGQPAESDPPAP